jgi:hypothetical protein
LRSSSRRGRRLASALPRLKRPDAIFAGYEDAPVRSCPRLYVVSSLRRKKARSVLADARAGARCDHVGMPDGARIAQAAAGRRSSNTASRQRRGRQVNNRKPFSFSSEAFAGVRIANRHQKEAQPEGQHDDIQHEVLLVAPVSGRDGCAFLEGRLRWIRNNKCLVVPDCKLPRYTYGFEMGVTGTL